MRYNSQMSVLPLTVNVASFLNCLFFSPIFILHSLQKEIAKARIAKLKFVCHDKQDSSHFAAVVQVPTADSGQKFIIIGLQAEKPVVSGDIYFFFVNI